MTSERVSKIREIIRRACEAEQKHRTLEIYLTAKLDSLHHSIQLPQDNAPTALVTFITQYIQHVPDFIDALTALSHDSGIYSSTKHFLIIAEDYFLQPPELVQDHLGLHALIDEAYLAHRLIEEINDRLMVDCGTPLAPMDMTLSNVIVHAIIGDEFANQLDLAVHYAFEALFANPDFIESEAFAAYMQEHRGRGWGDIVKNWPCLANDSDIELHLQTRSHASELYTGTWHYRH